MAGKDKPDYAALIKELKDKGPDRLYLLWGDEDYLKEQFLRELVKMTVGSENTEFNRKYVDFKDPDPRVLYEAVETMPFFSSETLVEVRNFDINKCRDETGERIKEIINDIPDYCVIAFVADTGVEPDGRLGLVKAVKKTGKSLEFAGQEQSLLLRWIERRFEANGKKIKKAEAEHLIFTGGGLMNGLIPEIDKISGYAEGEYVTIGDIDAVARRIPEAGVFSMTDMLAAGNYDAAARILSELIQMREAPIRMTAVIGRQMRHLLAAKVAADEGRKKDFVSEVCGIKFDFIVTKLMKAASGFSFARLIKAVKTCAEYDYKMKTSAEDDTELIKELFVRLSLKEEEDA
ncbi:MAG: DNA polymerase III subunit delta [Oscillospiraceae bacterium]|nr:DNA polymerase III subunit delta [Oscillospiraceae bacterium]